MPKQRRSAWRTPLVVLAFLLLNLAVVEVAVRVYYAAQIGPRVLLYGTPWQRNTIAKPKSKRPIPPQSVQDHTNTIGDAGYYTPGATGYSKYFPHESKQTLSPDHDEFYDVRINEHGFRGESYDIEKPPGTIRVLTLGASSTFGYHDRDDETYPFLLERDLESMSGGATKFEVINFAIPHATTDNIVAMLWNEGFALDPDVITFYEGANDAAVIEPRAGSGARSISQFAVNHFLALALVDRIVPWSRSIDLDWWWSDELANRRRRAFLANLDLIREECRKRGIVFIVATQQFRSTLIPNEKLEGVRYEDEVEFVQEKVRRGEIGPARREGLVSNVAFALRLDGFGAGAPEALQTMNMFDVPRAMLVHARLMAALRDWAAKSGVPLVDVIAKLDGQRHLLVNWVHLRGEANAVIADALAREILAQLAHRTETHARSARRP